MSVVFWLRVLFERTTKHLGDYSPRLRQTSLFNISRTDALIAALRLGYMPALTSSSSPSK